MNKPSHSLDVQHSFPIGYIAQEDEDKMGFSAMDGFYMAMFLAVCIVGAVILRFVCLAHCLNTCYKKRQAMDRDGDIILHNSTLPTIASTGQQPRRAQTTSIRVFNGNHGRDSNAVFTIYTFPQEGSPELPHQSRTADPPKYSALPCDTPPKYEDLFPQSSFIQLKEISTHRQSTRETSFTVPATDSSSSTHERPSQVLQPLPPPPSSSTSISQQSSSTSLSQQNSSNSGTSSINHIVNRGSPPQYSVIYPHGKPQD